MASLQQQRDLEKLYDLYKTAIADCGDQVSDIETLVACKKFLLTDHRLEPPPEIDKIQEVALRLSAWPCRPDYDVLFRICPTLDRVSLLDSGKMLTRTWTP